MKIYLDNCCYNRPYDDQSQLTISLETQAKIQIQNMVKNNDVELVGSYILTYECQQNPNVSRREPIMEFIRDNLSEYIGEERSDIIESAAAEIMKTGVKYKDAAHVASAIYAGCDYFISTDKRLLKYKSDSVKIVNPIVFISEIEGE